MQEETLDRLILHYLERRRFQQASRCLKEEAPALQNNMTLGPSLDSTSGMISQLVFHLVGDNDAGKYIINFDQLASWVDRSLDMYKVELQRLLYPIFIHCYLELINLNASSEGLQLLMRHKKRFVDQVSAASKSRQQELDDLRNVVIREQLATNPIARNARSKPLPVRLSRYSNELLFNFLHAAGLMLIVGIINQHIRIQVEDRQPRLQLEEEGDQEGSLFTGQLLDEAATANRKALNLLLLQGDGKAPEADAAAEAEEMDEDGKAGPTRKQKALQKAAEKERSLQAKAAAPGRAAEIPLLPTTEEWEAQMLEHSKHRVRVGSVAQPSCLFFSFLNTADTLNSVTFAPDGSALAGGFDDSSVRLYDLERMATASQKGKGDRLDTGVRVMHGHSDAVYSVSYSVDQRYVLSGGGDGSVRFWSTALAANLAVYRGHIFPVWDVATCPAGYYFASASADRTARIWCTERALALRILAGHNSDVDVVRWHPNSHYVATASSDRTVRLWDVREGNTQRVFLGHQAAVTSIAFSPDGTMLASGDMEGAVHLWDLAEGRKLASMKRHRGPVWSMDFSKGQGTLLATGSADHSLCLWNVATASGAGPTMGRSESQSAGHEGGFPLDKLRTKNTPVFAVAFTLRNLLLGAGSVLAPQRRPHP